MKVSSKSLILTTTVLPHEFCCKSRSASDVTKTTLFIFDFHEFALITHRFELMVTQNPLMSVLFSHDESIMTFDAQHCYYDFEKVPFSHNNSLYDSDRLLITDIK